MSHQAVTKHLGILKDAGLLRMRTRGRERLCTLNPEPLKRIAEWISRYDGFWEEKLQDLDSYLSD